MFNFSFKYAIKIFFIALIFSTGLTFLTYHLSFSIFPILNEIESIYTGLPLACNMFIVLNFFGIFGFASMVDSVLI